MSCFTGLNPSVLDRGWTDGQMEMDVSHMSAGDTSCPLSVSSHLSIISHTVIHVHHEQKTTTNLTTARSYLPLSDVNNIAFQVRDQPHKLQ